MKITKTINTSAALGIDDAGHDIIVLGKGIGFRKPPYVLEDLEMIDRTFYDVDPRYIEMMSAIDENVFLASADVVEQAEINLGSELNPNLAFTLADHLQFALERIAKNVDLTAPLAYDVQYLYPLEYELGSLALDIMEDYTGQRLPDSEAVTIALHIINSEAGNNKDQSAMMTFKVISEIDEIIENELQISLDKQSYKYSRFIMHVRYLVQRLLFGQPIKEESKRLYNSMAAEYPEIYLCARKVSDHLKDKYGWDCSKEEILYLMIHINRVSEKNE